MNKVYSDNTIDSGKKKVELKLVNLENEGYFKIANHWMFISSNGGLSDGRKNAEYALFPYYTDDKITELADTTGSKTIFRVRTKNQFQVWEPSSERFTGKFNISRSLYKNLYGNKIIFEEINHDLELTYNYQRNSSKLFDFDRKASLENTSENDYEITWLDGVQNIMPCGVPSDLQRSTSNLVDAYKRSELEPESGLGIFALSAIIVDKAEPSEALIVNLVWSPGLDNPKYLLSSLQLNRFRNGREITEEREIVEKYEPGTLQSFLNKNYIGNKENVQLFNVIGTVALILGIPFPKPLAKRFGKRKVYMASSLLSGIFFILLYLPGNQNIYTIYILNIPAKFTYAPTVPLLWTMIADTADYSEWKFERRAAGLVFSAATFAQKAGCVIGGALAGWLLALFQFVPNSEQTATSITGIKLMISVFPGILYMSCAILLYFYSIDHKTCLLMDKELVQRRNES